MKLTEFFRHYEVTHDTGNAPIAAALRKRVDQGFLCPGGRERSPPGATSDSGGT